MMTLRTARTKTLQMTQEYLDGVSVLKITYGTVTDPAFHVLLLPPLRRMARANAQMGTCPVRSHPMVKRAIAYRDTRGYLMEHAFHALILPLSMGILVSAHLDPTSMVLAYASVTMATRGYLMEHAFHALILPL